jgi:hypothetical protein
VRALQRQAALDGWFDAQDPAVRPVALVEPDSYPDAQLVGLKFLLAPQAYAAKTWSWLNEQVQQTAADPGAFDGPDAWSQTPFAPYAAAATWWRSGWDLWMEFMRQSGRAP